MRQTKKQYVLSMVWIVAAIIVLLAMLYQPTEAQDDPITVCRDATYPTLRFEFHDIPASWFVYGSDAAWGYWAGGVIFDTEHGAIIADPLEVDTDGYLAGTATVLDYDNAVTAVGDANSPPCAIVTPQPTKNAANGLVEPLRVQAMEPPTMIVAKRCIVKYPQIILVCG